MMALISFALCVFIVAFFRHTLFVRGLIGDFLVVILIYSFIKGIVDIKPMTLAVGTLLLSYLIEILQYLRFITLIGLENNTFAKLIMGSTFDPNDIIAYTLGAIFVYGLDKKIITRTIENY